MGNGFLGGNSSLEIPLRGGRMVFFFSVTDSFSATDGSGDDVLISTAGRYSETGSSMGSGSGSGSGAGGGGSSGGAGG